MGEKETEEKILVILGKQGEIHTKKVAEFAKYPQVSLQNTWDF